MTLLQQSKSNLFDSSRFSDPDLCRSLLDKLYATLEEPLRFMEVCGTHTVSIFRSGLRSLLPEGVVHLSGPGCPVCVTHEREVAAFLELAQKDNVVIATFGDLLRVPGPNRQSLKKAKADGAFVEVVYSPLDALALAVKSPDKQIVFLGVGFETTAPTVAATIVQAEKSGCNNFSVLCLHKLVPPVLDALLAESEQNLKFGIDAFLLPGHVSTIIGIEPYAFLPKKYNKSGVIAGFDPSDIINALLLMVKLRKEGKSFVCNEYRRAVNDDGNAKARHIMEQVFAPSSALWRGLGEIPESGLEVRPAYESFDAWRRFNLQLPDVPAIAGCKCGDVLKGIISPDKCSLFGKACTPQNPVGPCMVSTEGSCAAYHNYSY